MTGTFESPSLSDDLAVQEARHLDGMFSKDKYAYVLIVQPLDKMDERLVISNTTQELARKLLIVASEDNEQDGAPIEVPKLS